MCLVVSIHCLYSYGNFTFLKNLLGIEEADLVLLIGTNPRYEAPLINTRIRKAFVHNETNVALIGPEVDLTYDYEVLKFIRNNNIMVVSL